MKINKYLALLAIAGIMIFASCKKDLSTPDPLTKTEAEEAFTTAETEFGDVTDQIDSQTGLAVLNSFENIGLPGVVKKSISQNELFSAEDLKHMPSIAKGDGGFIDDNEPYIFFDYNALKGKTYTYSSETGWSNVTNGTNNVIIIIPYGDGGTATLTFSEYETKSLIDDTYVSHLKAEYKISTQATAVMTWVYTASRTITSQSYKFVYTIGDYTKTKSYTNDGYISKVTPTNSTKSWSVVWEKNGSTILARSFTKKTTYNTDQSYSVVISGKYRVKDIVIKWDIAYNQATDFNNPNSYITITVWTVDGAKVADIIFKIPVAKSEYALYIVFNDDTEMPLSEYLDYLAYVIQEFTWFIRYGGSSI